MEAIVGNAIAPWRFSASTIGFLSVLAIMIATLGVYGIVQQSSLERTREIAVRVALGASSRSIAGLVLREALLIVMGGIAVGLLSAGAASSVLTSLLFDVQPFDPLTFSAMAALLGIVALAATYVPARRAARVDPLVALRYE
jgi:putative ABC transport system permease protein